MLRVVVAVLALSVPASAFAGGECHVVDVDFLPATSPAPSDLRFDSQIVAWVETPAGQFVDTVFITRQVGTFGLGNRPGQFDFNSGPHWPYGRRITVFPVWSHKHGVSYPQVVFQNNVDSALSHSQSESSVEPHYCAPKKRSDPAWDAVTCASIAYTDKGRLGSGSSGYPPRNDLLRQSVDDPVIDMYATLNTFDAISGATPASGVPAAISWPIPPTVTSGDYVLWIEVAREFDYNSTYNETTYPSPTVAFGDYGVAYRGQPSILYKVPFTLASTDTTATALDYAGYGDPDGNDGAIRPPDATITTTVPGSGAQRFAVTNGYRVRVVARSEDDTVGPAAPGEPVVTEVGDTTATVAFVAPGDDGTLGRVAGYDLRYRVGEDITEANFDSSPQLLVDAPLDDPGAQTAVEIAGLLPETSYSIGIRAVDNCRNVSPLVVTSLTTTERQQGSVGWCFVATAAYGSVMANDVVALRSFRDRVLGKSVLGELAIEAYYTFGPSLAGAVGESDLLRATARRLLAPLVAAVGDTRTAR